MQKESGASRASGNSRQVAIVRRANLCLHLLGLKASAFYSWTFCLCIRPPRKAHHDKQPKLSLPGATHSYMYPTMATLGALPSRLAALTRLRCQVFQTSYNPTSMRTGAKYLKRRLRGPSMLEYYPERPDIAALIRQFPDEGLRNTAEETRLQDIIDKKARGKGTPKKAKTKGQSALMDSFFWGNIAY